MMVKLSDTSIGCYSVCQYFHDGTYEYVRQHVGTKEAIDAFEHYTHNMAVVMGITDRVVITDHFDFVVAEWKKKEGLVFPKI